LLIGGVHPPTGVSSKGDGGSLFPRPCIVSNNWALVSESLMAAGVLVTL